MLPDLKKGRGISGAVRYALGQGRGRGADWQPGEESRVAWISGQGFGFEIVTREDAELGRRIMEFAAANQASRTRQCEKDCLHLSLSWHPTEQPTQGQMEEAARDALKALGMENARALFVAHNDTKHAHLHIVASRINPETGRAFSDTLDITKINEWALQYERNSGVIHCPKREAIDHRDPEKVLEAVTNDRSTFTIRDLDRLLGRGIVSRLDRREIIANIMKRDDIVGLRETADGPVVRYTTRKVIEDENKILRDARVMHLRSGHGITETNRQHVLDRFAHLDQEQRQAFLHATNTEGLAIVAGEAGTGKSATMEAVREAYLAAGYQVRGLAWTNAVVQDMKRDGFHDTSTIASEMKRLESGLTQWHSRTVIIVDEAAMLATKHLARLTERARQHGAKLILVGDDQQLASIERGGMFGALRQEHRAAELHQVRRVSDPHQKHAFNRMHLGDFQAALEVFEAQQAIHWSQNQETARDALVAKYALDTSQQPDRNRFVFAYTNAEVDALNRDIRGWRKERGELGQDQHFETKHGRLAFAENDRIQFTGNARRKRDRDAGFTNGVVGTVRKIDGARMTVELDGKKQGKPRIVEFTVGDNIPAGQFNAIRHGYAGTIYKGQGRTLDQTYLYHSQYWRSASSYVALTRHREQASVFVARETAPDLDQLARQMARVDDRRAASQFHRDEPGKEREERPTAGPKDAERAAARARLEQALQPQRPNPERGVQRGPKRDPGLER